MITEKSEIFASAKFRENETLVKIFEFTVYQYLK